MTNQFKDLLGSYVMHNREYYAELLSKNGYKKPNVVSEYRDGKLGVSYTSINSNGEHDNYFTEIQEFLLIYGFVK